MALMFLRVVFLGAVAAAADDVSVTWFGGKSASLGCAPAHADRLQSRRPPPPLEGDSRVPHRLTWRKDGDEITGKRISSSGSLEVFKRRDGEGVYQCLVRQHGGLVMGYPINVKFASMDKQFSAHPANATAWEGEPFALGCEINSSPPADVSWLKDDLPVLEDDRYHMLKNQLLITNVTAYDEGTYRCIATNPYLNKSRTSHAGRLKVGPSRGDQPLVFLPLDLQADILAPRGIRVVLPCPVLGWPSPLLTWMQAPPDDRPRELDVTDQVFVIYSLEEDQQGVYTCLVEGTQLVKSFNVTLTEPAVIEIPPISKEVPKASTVRFNCTASGHPPPTIAWYKDGKPLSMTGRINLRKSSVGQRTELVISGVTSNDAGVYQCFAQNAVSITSSWAMLNVTGADAAAPINVQCWPVGDKRVKVTWEKPPDSLPIAYTIHATPEDKDVNSPAGKPYLTTEEVVSVDAALVPYRFQIRAYSKPQSSHKNTASDFSKPAVCQAQGVPIKLVKLNDTAVLVSWQQFAASTPGVLQWILQTRADNRTVETNVTLDGNQHNYTLDVSPSSPLQVRVLGSKNLTWFHQDLSLVPWTSTAVASADLDDGFSDKVPIPQDIQVSELSSRSLTVSWRLAATSAAARYVFTVCLRKEHPEPGAEDVPKRCQITTKPSATFEGLEPGTQYEITVKARLTNQLWGGAVNTPYLVTTPLENPQRFKELTCRFVNASTLQVSWNGPPASYTVHYSAELKLPVQDWKSIHTDNNTVLIPNIDPAETTFLMVTGYDPEEHSKIETIPPLLKNLEVEDIHYEYSESGIVVGWSGAGGRTVSFEQNITRALEQWPSREVAGNTIELTDLDPSKTTYVMVSTGRKHQNQVLTIPPRPVETSNLSLIISITVGVLSLCLMALAAVFIWRKRKRLRSPSRARRRTATGEENDGEESEMKGVGGRLANGGARGAGQPLLNGHVHITENPTSKTPNGKMKKGRRCEVAFDVSRYEEPTPDTTQETILSADTSTSYSLLDTSRKPEFDPRSSRDVSANNSFAKLPDDNMNSELTRSTFQLDNSKIQPTLQPNG